MKSFIFIVCLITLATSVHAQNIKRAYKHIEKENYDKALEEFQAVLAEDSINALAYNGLSLVYSTRDFENYDLFMAYENSSKAQLWLDSLSEEALAEAADYCTPEQVQKQTDKVDEALYAHIKRTADIETVERFLVDCPDSRYYLNVLDIKYDLEFRRVKEINTIAAYNEYLELYPYAQQSKQVAKLRDNLAFEGAQRTATIAAYTTFIETYPESERLQEAKDARSEIAFNQAAAKNTVEAYSNFLQEYPASVLAAEAQKRRSDIAYNEAIASNTVESFTKFLKDFSRTNYGREIFNLKSQTLGQEIASANKHGGNIVWLKGLDNNGRRDRAEDMLLTFNGKILLLGRCRKASKWYNDPWLVMLDEQGNLIWEKTLGGRLSDELNAVTQCPNGDLIFVGHSRTKTPIPSGAIWAVRLDASGKQVWSQTYKTATDALGVAVDNNGEAVLVGYIARRNGRRDFWVMKIDNQGNKLWEVVHNGKGVANDAVINDLGEIVIVGEEWVLKTDANGNSIWDHTFVKTEHLNREVYPKPSCVLNATDGGVYIAGNFYNFRIAAKSDYWIVKIDNMGNQVWEKTFNNANKTDEVSDIAIDTFGNPILVGTSGEDNKQDTDIWLLKLDYNGNKTEERFFGTPVNEKNPKLKVSSNGEIYIFSHRGLEADWFILKYNN